jgi:AcrR family transcriptional regulator
VTTKDAYHHGDLRNALVRAATRLVQRSGDEQFSLREAARAVGVSANAAYRHFADKSALLTAVAGEGFTMLAERMEEGIRRSGRGKSASRAAVDAFRAVGRTYVEFALAEPRLFRLMFGPHGAECPPSARTTPWQLFARSLDALVATGAMPPERRRGAELSAWTVVHGYAALALDLPTAVRAPTGASLEEVLEFAIHGLCAP